MTYIIDNGVPGARHDMLAYAKSLECSIVVWYEWDINGSKSIVEFMTSPELNAGWLYYAAQNERFELGASRCRVVKRIEMPGMWTFEELMIKIDMETTR